MTPSSRFRTAIRDIVQQLDSVDPAVRLLAISALQRITGQTLGYEHDAPQLQREEAIRRWVQAVESGEFQAFANEDLPSLAQGQRHE